MTTLAIIGSGIAGRSLLYVLSKEKTTFEKITLVYSDKFTSPCTLSSTAIVAPRGITKGHSALGDLLLESYETFSQHVKSNSPDGVETITQYTAATEKLDAFKKRYPHGEFLKSFLKSETYVARDKAFLINPEAYTNWLLSEAKLHFQDKLEIIHDFVTEIQENDCLHLKTHDGRSFKFDKVVMTGGTYNRFWKDLAPASRPVQGSYLEFKNVPLSMDSFSLTYNKDNLVWSKKTKTLLIGSTGQEVNHLLSPEPELQQIYHRLSEAMNFELPDISLGEIKVGLREKAKKREPYIHQNGHVIFFGGLYKNGFNLSLKMSRTLSHQYL